MGFKRIVFPLGVLFAAISAIAIAKRAEALVISSPQNGTIFSEGETITIRVETSPGEDTTMPVLIIPTTGDCPELKLPPYECRVTIPPGSPRTINIGALGKPFRGDPVFANDISVVVRVTATLQGLRVNDDQRTIFPIVGSSRKLYIYGQYSDGIERHLEDPATGTTYESSDPKVATIDANGLVKAVAPGKAVITVKNGDKQLQVQVVVDAK